MKKKVFIEGMTCQNCVRHATEALKELAGVQSVEVSLENKSAIIEVDNVADEDIKNAIEEVGYNAIKIKEV